jgi:uncharacterized protein (TIGR02271 family)
MIGTDTIDRVIGKDVYDPSGEKIGSASEVYLDDETGQPEWATVRTGLFGGKESFVPIRDAELTEDGLRVPVSKDQIKDAPKIDSEGHLSPEEEQELYRYYGMAMSGGTGRSDTTTERPETADTSATGRTGTTTAAGPTDEAMTRSEERLNVGTHSGEVGRARLRKYVVTENVTETVPVSREQARVEREPITEANRDQAMSGPAISEAEHEVVLHGEQPVVEKESVPVERVRLDTETVTEQQAVSDQVAKEQIEVDTDDGDRRG